MQELARYWATDYDWRRCEAKLNALPHFMTEIDGLDIHFIHVRSQHEDALPLIVTHGWPGSIIEQLKIIEPLTDPTAHGGERGGRVPSGDPVDAGLRVLRQADHHRLGSGAHRARLGRADEAPRLHASSWRRAATGARPSRRRWASRRLRSCSASTPTCPAPPRPTSSRAFAARRPAAGRSLRRGAARVRAAERLLRQARRLRADHGDAPADAVRAGGLARRPRRVRARPRRRHRPARPGRRRSSRDACTSDLTRDDILDNITLYWLTNTGVSAARLYWENKAASSTPRTSRSRSPSASSPTSCTRRRGAGPSGPTRQPHPLQPGSTEAATSRPGSSRSSSPRSCAPRSGRCASRGRGAPRVRRPSRARGGEALAAPP